MGTSWVWTVLSKNPNKWFNCLINKCLTSVVVVNSGLCHSWGRNSDRKLGNNTQTDCFEPKLINGFKSECIIAISCGLFHPLVLIQTGKVYRFGSNVLGSIGCGHERGGRLCPTKVFGIDSHKIVSISCGLCLYPFTGLNRKRRCLQLRLSWIQSIGR